MDYKDAATRLLEAFFAHNPLTPKDALEITPKMYAMTKEIFNETTPEGLVRCKLCGQRMKRLRRHLTSRHGISIDEYCKQTGTLIEEVRP
jgi:predicted transcriptional regulator